MKKYNFTFPSLKKYRERFRFLIFKHLQNGVVCVGEGKEKTLERALMKVRKGGYVVVLPSTIRPNRDMKNRNQWKPKKQPVFFTDKLVYFPCSFCKKMNLLSSPEGVKAIKKWRKDKEK